VNGKNRATHFEGAYLSENILKWWPFVLGERQGSWECSSKISHYFGHFAIFVELAMHNGHWNESSVCGKNKNGHICLFLKLLGSILFEVGNICIGWLTFQSIHKLNKKTWAMNYTTPFNLRKFHKIEFNLEFDKTTTIEFIR